MTEEYLTYGHRLEQHIADTAKLMWELLDDGEKVIFEGAQGAMLDIDHGTYPFVTSSNPLVGRGLRRARASGRRRSTRSGASPRPTRRASAPGPFPSELHDEMGELIRARGGEFGTTTGRPRRTGWLDLVALRYAARLNTMTALVITKLDVLSGLDRIQVVHELPRRAREPSSTTSPTTRRCCTTRTAELTELRGWNEDLGECRTISDLPDGGARVPRVHRRARRRAVAADRRRTRARAGRLDRRRACRQPDRPGGRGARGPGSGLALAGRVGRRPGRRVRAQQQRRARLLLEVEALGQVAEPRDFFAHVGRASGRPSVVGFRRALARKSSSMNFR